MSLREDFELDSGQYWDSFSCPHNAFHVANGLTGNRILSGLDEEIESILLRKSTYEEKLIAFFFAVRRGTFFPFRMTSSGRRQKTGPLTFYLCFCWEHKKFYVTYPQGFEGRRPCPQCDIKNPSLHPSLPTAS